MLDNQFGVASPGLDLLSYSDSVSYVNIACNRLLGGPVTPDCRPGTATLPPRTRRTTTWRTPAASPDTGNLRAVLATGSGLLLLAAVVRMLTMMMVVMLMSVMAQVVYTGYLLHAHPALLLTLKAELVAAVARVRAPPRDRAPLSPAPKIPCPPPAPAPAAPHTNGR